MSRIELKCRCGAEAKWDDGCAEHEERIRRLAREWLALHQNCLHQPAAAALPGITIGFPEGGKPFECVHDFEQTTAGHRCRKCGFSTVGSSSWGTP